MENVIKRISVIAVIIAMMLAFMAPYMVTEAQADASPLVIKSYTSNKYLIEKGDIAELTITLKWSGTGSAPATIAKNNVSISGGSFASGAVESDLTLSGDEYTLKIIGLQYRGSGNSLSFTIDKSALGTASNANLSMAVTQCEEYVAPEQPKVDIQMPTAIVSRSDMAEALKPGETIPVTITIENTGKTTMTRPILELDTSDEINLAGTQTTYNLPDIVMNKSTSITVNIKANSKITNAKQALTYKLDFTYLSSNDGTRDKGTAEGRISIPCMTSKEEAAVDSKPAPTIVMKDFSYGGASVKQGQDFDLKIVFRNTSPDYKLENITATVDTGSDLTINGATNTKYFSSIDKSSTGTITIPVRAVNKFSGSNQAVNVSFKYDYVAGGTRTTEQTSFAVNVPLKQENAVAGTSKPVPSVIVKDFSYGGKDIQGGQEFKLKVNLKNTSRDFDIENVTASFDTGAELAIDGASNTKYFKKIEKNSEAAVSLPIKASKTLSGTSQTVNINIKYDYVADGTRSTEQSTVAVAVPLVQSAGADGTATAGPVPNVIVQNFSYGGESVAAGAAFTLNVDLKNTSKVFSIENVVATVEGGQELILDGSTNTVFFDRIGANSTATVSVPYKLSRNMASQAQIVNVSVKYEYVDNDVRNSGSATLTISVPCYQPDELEIGEPKLAFEPCVYEETSFTMDYVNKGKSEISNFEISVSGDDCMYAVESQRIGNIDPGKSGTIAFSVTPTIEGENKVTINISYEDANGEIKERTCETTINAYPAYVPEDPDFPVDPVTPEKTTPKWLLPLIIAIVVIAAIVAFTIFRKKKKAKKEKAKWDSFNLDDELGDK